MTRSTAVSMLVLLGLLALSAPARGQALVARDGSLLSLDLCRVRATLEEGVALVDIDQVFRNAAHNPRSGTYRIKLPRDAVIHSFSMWIDDREKQGRVLEAKAARRTYDKHVRLEKRPALLEQEGWRSFRVSVAEIPARDTVRIRLRYAYVLPDDLGLQTLEIPMVEEIGEIGECLIQVEASGNRELALLESPSHPGAKAVIKGNRGELAWARENWTPTGSFLVRLMPKHDGLDLTVLTHREQDAEEGFFLIRVLPKLDAPKPLPRDIVFVMDRSGSMKEGKKMAQARQALLHGLETLRPEDRFNVISFSTTTRLLKNRAMLDVNDDNLALAREAVAAMEPGGSTNIDQALTRALSLRDPESERLFLLVFLTDGIPTVGEKKPRRIIESYRQASGGKVRLFAFGVGDGVKDFLLTHLARGSRGTAVYVREDEDLEIKLSILFTKVGRPLLTDPEIRIAGSETVDVVPEPLPDLYRGEALVLAGKYRGGGPVELQLSGRLGTGRIILDFPSSFPTDPVNRAHVAQLWAKYKIDRLLDDLRMHGLIDEIKQSIIDLGVRYQVVTPYTSFLVVEDDVHVPDPAEMAKVPEPDADDEPDDLKDKPGADAPVAKVDGSNAGKPTQDAPEADERHTAPPPKEEEPDTSAPDAPPPAEAPPPSEDTDPSGPGIRQPASETPPDMRSPSDPPPPSSGGGANPPPPEDAGGDGSAGGRSGRPPSDSGGSTGGGTMVGGSTAGPTAPTGAGSRKTTNVHEVSPDSWEHWWAVHRDHVLALGSGLPPLRRPEPGKDTTDVVLDRILPALEAVVRKDDRVPAMQAEVALALAKLGASRPEAAGRISMAVLKMAYDGRPQVEDSAITALGVLGYASDEVVMNLLKIANETTYPARGKTPARKIRESRRGRALIALGMLEIDRSETHHARIVLTLKKALETKSSSANIRSCALIALGLCGTSAEIDAIEPWIKWHRGKKDGELVGSNAVAAIARIHARRKDGAKDLFDHLAQSSSLGGEHARTAVLLLGEIGSRPEFRGRITSNAIRAVERTARRGEPQASGLALLALGQIAGTAETGKLRARAYETLRTGLKKGEPVARPYAALGIGLMGHSIDTTDAAREGMREAVREYLENKAHRLTPRDRGAVAIALGLLGDAQSRPALRGLAKSRGEVRRVRGGAALALGLIRSGKDKLVLRSLLDAKRQEDRLLRLDACVAAGLHAEDSLVDRLHEILTDPDTSLYNLNSAALGIAHAGRTESVETLIKLVRTEKAPAMNRAMAIVTIGLMVDRSPVPALRRLAVESNHRALPRTLEAILRSQ